MFYLILFLLVAIFFSLYFYFKKKKNYSFDKFFKIISIIYVSLCFLNVFLPDAFALRYIWDFNYLKENHDSLHAIMRCFYAMSIITLPFAIFFKKKNFVRVTICILLPTCLINIIFYKQFIEYYTSPLTSYGSLFGNTLLPYLTNRTFRTILFGTILLLELLQCIYILINYYKMVIINTWKEFGMFLTISLLLFVSNMPIYTMQQLTGTVTNITFNFLDPSHIIFMLFIILEATCLYFGFKNQSKEDKYILLLVMSISLLFQYNTFFKTDGIITATRYPLQLCNIAGAFLIITLLTKNEKMFHFTATINVTGAIIAIILCDSTKNVGILYCMNIHYMVEHINVLLVPILALLLKVFKPLTKKDVKHVIIGFSIYFGAIFIIGTILNGMVLITNNTYFKCNYLFMFDKDAATRLVGSFVGKLFDIKITIFNYFNIYLVQVFVYLVFLTICIGMYYLIYFLFDKKRNLNENSNKNDEYNFSNN